MNDCLHKKRRKRSRYSTREFLRRLRLSHATLKQWERLGIIRPRYFLQDGLRVKEYTQRDVDRGMLIKLLIENGVYNIEKALEDIEQLRN